MLNSLSSRGINLTVSPSFYRQGGGIQEKGNERGEEGLETYNLRFVLFFPLSTLLDFLVSSRDVLK